jgi:hypothetical protein
MKEIAQAMEQAVGERTAPDLHESMADCGCLPIVGVDGRREWQDLQ